MKHNIAEVSKGAKPADYIGQVVRIPTKRVKQLSGQPRTYFDAMQLKRLRESIQEIGQQQPATVIPWEDGTFRLRDGERRWRSCVDLGIPLVALVVDAKSTEEEFELSAAANMNRESHSPLEKALAMKRLRDGPLKRSVSEIARTFGVTDTTVASHLLVVDSLPQTIIDLMDPNKQGNRKRTLQVSVAVRLTALKGHPRQQLAIANRVVRDGLPMSQAIRMIDAFADERQISAGRGRERCASDRLDLLNTAIRNLRTKLEFFAELTPSQIDELFDRTPIARVTQTLADVVSTIEDLEGFRSKFAISRRRHVA